MTRDQAGKPIEILMVEDNPGDVELVVESLQNGKLSNQLHVVSDGEEALTFLHRQGTHANAPRPDLILLDLNLPKKGGGKVLAEIKADERLRAIPVVVLTTSKSEEDVLRSYQLNANCYVAKPVDFHQFEKIVRAIREFWFSIVILPPRD